MAAKTKHRLMFSYVNLRLLDCEKEEQGDYKIFQVEPDMIRLRRITFDNGVEVEGDNLWVPITSIAYLREIGQ